MEEHNVLIGGRAGDGIKFGAELLANIFRNLGYYVFGYVDYQSLIRGGHNFAVIRASERKVMSHRRKVDTLIALDKNTVDLHREELKGKIIFDSSSFQEEGVGIPAGEFVKERGYSPIIRNTVLIGGFCGCFGIPFEILEKAIRETLEKKIEENLEAAKYGYREGSKSILGKIKKVGEARGRVLTGNTATAIGLVKGGLKVYLAYPMTPSTPILHYLVEKKEEYGIKVYQPENEISVINMAVGSAYAGARTAIGTSGGGFGLMIEGLSLIGMSETPLVIVEVQRAGPSTGVPTYTMQGDLFHTIFSGHGEFPRIVVAPGDPDQAFYYSRKAMNLAWKFQVPVIILSDKHLGESLYTAEFEEKEEIESPKLWNGEGEYKRYEITEDGISPLAFPGTEGIVVKATSYEHDEFGITTEGPEIIKRMQEKRRRKMESIIEYLKKERTVDVLKGSKDKVLITWGSTKGVVWDVAEELGLTAVQPIYLEPFPEWEVKEILKESDEIICVEVNSTGLLSRLLRMYGINVSRKILKYDARPFTYEDLLEVVG